MVNTPMHVCTVRKEHGQIGLHSNSQVTTRWEIGVLLKIFVPRLKTPGTTANSCYIIILLVILSVTPLFLVVK